MANFQPIYPLTPKIAWTTMTAANTAKDGTGTVGSVTAVAGLSGYRLDSIKVRALGTNVASVLRLFVNNGGANSTPANNSLFMEISLPSTTVTELAATTDIAITFNDNAYALGVANAFPQVVLPTGYKINATIGTAVAAGWQVTSVGGDY